MISKNNSTNLSQDKLLFLIQKLNSKSSYLTVFLLLMILELSAQIKLTVNIEKNLREISPYIYGRNNSFSSTNPTEKITPEDLIRIRDARVTFFRENGGNNSSKYNWRKKLSSHPDWYNNVYTNDWDGSVLALQKHMPEAQGMWAFQLLGWVAKTNQFNFNDWNYNKSQWWEGVNQNLAGNGELNPTGGKAKKDGDYKLYLEPWPADSSTAILDHWFNTLKINKEKVLYWNMDNEAEIWNGTHDDVMPTLISAEEFIQRYIKTAKSARAKFPNIKLVGPVTANEWQWYNWNNDAIQYNGRKYPWMEYFLLRIAEEEKISGVKLLDVVDIHFYPGTNKPNEITQLHRVFFDQNFVFPEANGVKRINGGWDNTQNKEYIFTRINNWLDQYFGTNHGKTLGLTEVGINTDDANLSAVWYASTLGEFMKNGVEIFTPWTWKPGMWEVLNICSNRNNTIYVSGQSDNEEKVSIYPTLNKSSDNLSMLVINKTSENQTVNINSENFILENNIEFYSLSSLPKTETFISSNQNAIKKESVQPFNNSISITLKPYSVNHLKSSGKKGKFENLLLANQSFEPLIIYPNPTTKTVYLKGNTEKILSIQLFDMKGTLIYKSESKIDKIELPNGLQPGIYNLNIQTDKGLEFKKIYIE